MTRMDRILSNGKKPDRVSKQLKAARGFIRQTPLDERYRPIIRRLQIDR